MELGCDSMVRHRPNVSKAPSMNPRTMEQVCGVTHTTAPLILSILKAATLPLIKFTFKPGHTSVIPAHGTMPVYAQSALHTEY